MLRKIVSIVLVIAIIAVLAIFGVMCLALTADATQDYPLKIWKQNENGMFMTLNVVDEKTGVNYVVVSGELYDDGIGVAICPRYNADGSLYTTD